MVREIDAATITETVARMAVEATHFLAGGRRRRHPRCARHRTLAAGRPDHRRDPRERRDRTHADAAALPGHRHRCRPPRGGPGRSTSPAAFCIDAVNEGIRRGYADGYLRKSIAARPFSSRGATPAITRPAVIHTEIVPGDQIQHLLYAEGRWLREHVALPELPSRHGQERRHRLRVRNR